MERRRSQAAISRLIRPMASYEVLFPLYTYGALVNERVIGLAHEAIEDEVLYIC
jgi:hypothetical protein